MNDQQTPVSLTPTRFSGLAVLAFLLALGSILACGIPFAAASISASLTYAVFAMPGIGLAAALIGFISTRFIARSNGAVAGRPLALIAIFVGLTAAILQGALVIGAFRTVQNIRTTLVPEVHTFIAQLDSDEAARSMLSPAVANNLPAEDIQRFNSELTAFIGEYIITELQLLDVLTAASELRARATPGAQIPDFDGRPVIITGTQDRAVAYVFLDQASIEQSKILFVDLIVVIPDQDRAIILQQDGPAATVARAISLATTGSP